MTACIDELDRIDELDAYKGKWRNLWFLKTARVIQGGGLYNSEQEANEASVGSLDRAKAKVAQKGGIGRCRMKVNDIPVMPAAYFDEVSHAIPMPVGGE